MSEDTTVESERAGDAEESAVSLEQGEQGDDDAGGDEDEAVSLDYGGVGGAELRAAVGKLRAYRSGEDEAVVEDVDDVPRRTRVLMALRPDVKRTAVETTLPLSLTVYSIFVAFFLLLMNPESDAVLYLTAENRIGDLFVADVALIGLFTLFLLVGPVVSRALDLEVSKRLRRVAVAVVGVLQVVPVALLSLFVGATFSGEEVARRGYDLYLESIRMLKPQTPEPLVNAGEWYYAVSPIGVSARDILAVMFVAGVVFAIPYVVRLLKAGVFVVASAPEDFPQLEDDDEDMEAEEFDPMDAVEYTRETDERASYLDVDVAVTDIEALLDVPDEMRVEPYPDYREVQRYWVRAPYSYVCILKDDSQGDYRYYVVEPEVESGEEELILQEFNERLSTTLLFKHIEDENEEADEEEEKVRVIEQEVLRLANEYNIEVNAETFHKLLYYIERDYVYYGKIDPLMNDENVEDISCDGNNVPLFVFHRHYNDLLSNISFETEELRQFITELSQRSGEHISAAKPLLDASLPDGSRIQMSLGGEVTTRGSTFTIRRFQEEPFTPIDLIYYDTFSLEQMAYLWLAIEHDKSLIFSGGTASGKTTSMNAVSLFIPPKAKVVTIEDTKEISLPHENWIPGVTREGFGGSDGQGAVTMYNLLKAALRQRPEYMIVGEIRGSEAETLFQAMSTGHTTYSTMHADTVRRAINRLTNPPINVPMDMVSSLDIVCIQNQVRITDPETGDVKNVRRNESTSEIVDVSEDSIRSQEPFYRDAEMDEFRSNLGESHVLESVRKEQGMSEIEVREELENREEVLQYLMDNDIRDVEDVTRTIQAYMLNKRPVLKAVQSDSLEPSEFKDITNVHFKHPDDNLAGGNGLSESYDDVEGVLPDDAGDGGEYGGMTSEPDSANSNGE
jgi:type IV secretory pathway ATPase VirB11/archaellum biosynthesis ATPase